MIKKSVIFGAIVGFVALFYMSRTSTALRASSPPNDPGIYGFELLSIKGKSLPLSQFEGHPILIVNVASKCGFTKQYSDLEALYQQFKDQGLVILGVPANNFGNQEPGNNLDIQTFCQTTYGVTFPMASKISVKGADIHPLYRYLTTETSNASARGAVNWNFNKFLIGKNGRVIARYASIENPRSERIISDIQKEINAK